MVRVGRAAHVGLLGEVRSTWVWLVCLVDENSECSAVAKKSSTSRILEEMSEVLRGGDRDVVRPPTELK